MSRQIRCNGPACDIVAEESTLEYSFTSADGSVFPRWLTVVDMAGYERDFHDLDCMVQWGVQRLAVREVGPVDAPTLVEESIERGERP